MDKPTGREISIKVREAPDYKRIGATGVYGGLTPTGHLMCNFFIEFNELPTELKQTLQDDGSLGSLELNQTGSTVPTLIRELQVGILLAPQLVRSIGEWFIAQSDLLEQLRQSTTPQMDKE
jgi:hypothetical protein